MNSAVRVSPWAALVLGVASLAGLVMLVWPLLARGGGQVQPPFVFLVLVPVVLAVVLAETLDGGLDPRVLAVLGVLCAIEAVLRGISAGTAGVELVFFLLVLAGRVFGPGFGFVLGCLGLLASALFAAGVGPWLPYQMLVAGWVGLGAGLLPRRVRGRAELVMLAGYGVLASYAYGLFLNLQGWPLLTSVNVPGAPGGLTYDPAAPLGETLVTFAKYTLITSTTSWDTARAITTAVAVLVLGSAVLTTLRRAARRATVVGEISRAPDDTAPETAK